LVISDQANAAVSFFAGVVPTGLSTLAVAAFALGHRNLRRNRFLVRRLRALGNLASVQVVCLDKTGTLTHNRMTVTEISAGGRHVEVDGGIPLATGSGAHPHSGPDISWLIKLCVLRNEVDIACVVDQESPEGSSTERSFIELAHRAGMDPAALREEHPIIHITHRP
jgi:magnesium-transporting ATPase (P-type)